MKKFFEEYGFIILTCVVVIALVGIAIGIKPLMASSISNITNSWGSEAKDSLNNAWNEDGICKVTYKMYVVNYEGTTISDASDFPALASYIPETKKVEQGTEITLDDLDKFIAFKSEYTNDSNDSLWYYFSGYTDTPLTIETLQKDGLPYNNEKVKIIVDKNITVYGYFYLDTRTV